MQDGNSALLSALEAELCVLGALTELKSSAAFMQHGDTSVLLHSVAVAYYACRLLDRLGLQYDRRALLRGALLHDYFLYDWHNHDKEPGEKLHAFSHPVRALENASSCLELSEKEREIILRHMFPVTVIPPRTREALAVCIADKWCAMNETFIRGAYPRLRQLCERILGIS